MSKTIKRRGKNVVLVGVVKSKRDFEIIKRERWYRIPAVYAPKRKYEYAAFYEPKTMGRGKRIHYYAKVLSSKTRLRRELLPRESSHPRVSEPYVRLELGQLRKLKHSIRNALPRRVSFGFTTLRNLKKARTILDVYGVARTEELFGKRLERMGIIATAQYYVRVDSRHAFLDFAVRCARGNIAIECDNKKAHSGKRVRERDEARDATLRRHGWHVLRFSEDEIMKRPKVCIAQVQKAIHDLGGVE